MGLKEKCLLVLIAIMAIALVPEAINHFKTRVTWESYSDEGRRLVKFGDPEKTVEYFKTESQKVLREGKSSDPRYIATLEGMAMGYEKQGLYLSALDQVGEALDTLNGAFFKDRVRIGQVMELKADILDAKGEPGTASSIRSQIKELTPWWQWFWSCFIIAFATEALYLANVLARPDDIEWSHFKVDHAMVYVWSVLIATVGMIRGLLMQGMSWDMALFLGMGISLAAFPALFGAVLACAENLSPMDSRKLLEPPSRSHKRSESL
ncbi:MAG: hypothetical protein IPM23_18115 [Candidatus Melainabacteria bacterium]|nr:hypothetical protein [Candidatus Melainabacteria bacterium]